MSTTKQRSKVLMESEGYHVENVEHYSPFSKRFHDLFGFADLLCVHLETGDQVLVQATTAQNVSARISKITDHENLPIVRKAGYGIQVHGWRKAAKTKQWVVNRRDIS